MSGTTCDLVCFTVTRLHALTFWGHIYSFTQDKLAKEEHNSALNLNKINTQWRTVLREVKTRELHKDIEILSQTFERVVDCKDSVIKVGALPKETLKPGCLDLLIEWAY